MSVKTVRFNKQEEKIAKRILTFYKMDFSACVKELMEEKLEDLIDIGHIKKFREGKSEDYFTSKEIDRLFHNSK